jgi:hypothetical protein
MCVIFGSALSCVLLQIKALESVIHKLTRETQEERTTLENRMGDEVCRALVLSPASLASFLSLPCLAPVYTLSTSPPSP